MKLYRTHLGQLADAPRDDEDIDSIIQGLVDLSTTLQAQESVARGLPAELSALLAQTGERSVGVQVLAQGLCTFHYNIYTVFLGVFFFFLNQMRSASCS